MASTEPSSTPVSSQLSPASELLSRLPSAIPARSSPSLARSAWHGVGGERKGAPAVLPAVEPPGRVPPPVRGAWPGGCGYVPALRIGRIDDCRPAVAQVPALVRRLPALPAVPAPGRTIAGGLVGPT